jgi:hypothetical protein
MSKMYRDPGARNYSAASTAAAVPAAVKESLLPSCTTRIREQQGWADNAAADLLEQSPGSSITLANQHEIGPQQSFDDIAEGNKLWIVA